MLIQLHCNRKSRVKRTHIVISAARTDDAKGRARIASKKEQAGIPLFRISRLFLSGVDIIQDLLPLTHVVNKTVDAIYHLLRVHMAMPEMEPWSIPHGLLRMILPPVVPGKE